MKKYLNYLTAALFLSLAVLSSCGGDDSDGDGNGDGDGGINLGEVAELINGDYTATSVTQPGDAGDWDSFVLTISGATASGADYAAAGVPAGYEAVWPASGELAFSVAADGSLEITRDGSIDMDATQSSTGADLELSFEVTTGAARTNSVNGTWTFDLEKSAN
ncbi:hypothetical protein [Reichenbachiella agariperforans]|uniref:hypothetical protein n=1 Tax=Reichenbachiella agariperforans TaxID=156994 RepID=UPI001C09AC1B|nr:hypothetical protein [Reichenbachiella agariperforans]MBU2914352.1 hypothetical protein [Reichenbachiella agariperforans]